jgi:hypothetical protein
LVYEIKTFDDMLNFISQINMSLSEPKNESFIKNNTAEFLKLSARLPSIVNSDSNSDTPQELIINYKKSEQNFRRLQLVLKKNVFVKQQKREITNDEALTINKHIETLNPHNDK